ncbi:MAG: PQQ-dependent sugar dehydrogenase [Flavobacterium sp.]
MKKILLLLSLFTLMANAQTVALQSFATGFSSAVEITHAPNDSRLFVVQQGGIIKVVSAAGVVNATPFLTLTTTTIATGGERGLLGLAFHPNYASNGYFYVNYTRASDGATVIARYTVSSNPDIADASSGTVLMTIAQPFSNHNGGTIKFGPDGYLYIGMGDGGDAGDPGDRAQNINVNLGKMLRIDVNSGSPYSSPSTNPYFGATAGNDEIWAIGLRNPWKFSFNRLTGDLWIADVGQGVAEEINMIASPLPNTGLNFGWRCYEGDLTYDVSSGNCPPYSSTVPRITQYGHSLSRCSVTGGYFYTGSTYPNFANKYFFADYCTAEIAYISGTNATITWALNPAGSLTTFGEDMNGELYCAISGVVYKIIDSSMSISDFEKNGFTMYPNPAKDKVFIKSATNVELSKIELFDITGKLLLTELAQTAAENNFSISSLAKGMYVVAIETQTGNKYQSKLIVD